MVLQKPAWKPILVEILMALRFVRYMWTLRSLFWLFLLPALSIAASLSLNAASWGLSVEHTFALSQRFWFSLMPMVMEVVTMSTNVRYCHGQMMYTPLCSCSLLKDALEEKSKPIWPHRDILKLFNQCEIQCRFSLLHLAHLLQTGSSFFIFLR